LYIAKMQCNANGQKAGYGVLVDGMKCKLCARA